MSQTKYPLPDDIKGICINLVRGYKKRVKRYHEARADIIKATPPPNVIKGMLPHSDPEKRKKGEMEEVALPGRRGNTISDETFDRAQELEEYEQHSFDAKAIYAVDMAKFYIGIDWPDEGARQKLVIAIWDSCMKGRDFKFNHYDLPIGTNNFYERRRQFLWHIANNMGFL